MDSSNPIIYGTGTIWLKNKKIESKAHEQVIVPVELHDEMDRTMRLVGTFHRSNYMNLMHT